MWSARERTFTLPELVALLERAETRICPTSIDVLAPGSTGARGARPQNAGQIPEIADPLDANQRQFVATASVLRDLSYRLVVGLFSGRDGTEA